jgi:F-type H+-transporting ATPase subunit delta
MTISAVVHRYANALADVVTAAGSTLRPEDALSELRAFEAAVESSPELRNALITPSIPASRKKAVVGKIADVLKLSRVTRNLLFVLIDHRRIASLPELIQRFELIVDERMGFIRAEISSARELTEPQRAELSRELERLTGKRIRMHFAVDESLIGGLIAHVGSTVYDGSVRGSLESLGRRLSAER